MNYYFVMAPKLKIMRICLSGTGTESRKFKKMQKKKIILLFN